MDYDYIRDHALKNVWCAPGQDQQFIIAPAKITPRHGAVRNAQVLWRLTPLPDQTSRWHIYQIGGIHPLAFNLFAKCFEWTSLAKACNDRSIIAQVYNVNGVTLPLARTFYRYTEDQNLIIAARIDSKIPFDLNYEDLYLRLYTNSYFQSSRSQTGAPPLSVRGEVPTNAGMKAQLLTHYNVKASSPGKVWLNVNGVRLDAWSDSQIAIGDNVEIIHDPSVYKSFTLDIKDLPVFDSSLDQLRKYLVRYEGADLGTIDYQDDIDVYVLQPREGIPARGVYYHKNMPNAMRNLTHRDYSLVVPYIRRYADAFELMTPGERPFINETDLKVEINLRHSGFERPLQFEKLRIHEMYRMSHEDINRAMSGIDSTLPYWRAETLEAASYPLVMRAKCEDVTNAIAEDAYGYNALGKVLADTPSVTTLESGLQQIDVPYKLQFGCTAYEYDEDGLLLGWRHHYVGSKYACQNPDARLVELVAGYGGNILDEHYGVTSMPLKKKSSYRVYECRALGGLPDNKWKDITGEPNKYTVIDDVFTWTSQVPTAYPMVRSDARFFCADYELDLNQGQLALNLQSMQNREGSVQLRPMSMPLGQLDVWMNGASLIRGLDYFVVFPRLYIVNKEYLKTPLSEKQKIHVRFMGFANKDGTMDKEGDVGFVEHGLLSNNKRYDIRDDKVQRIVVGGQLKSRADLIFSEFHTGVAVMNPQNGRPYMVKDLLIPVKTHTTSDTYELRDESRVIDKAVSDYLTLKLPQPPRDAPSAIPLRYKLMSPFCNKLIFDLKFNRLNLPTQTTGFSRQQIMELCKNYEYLLQADPCQALNEQDARYVVIHPHGLNHIVELPQREYQFMYQVVEHYTRGLVTLSPSVRLLNNP